MFIVDLLLFCIYMYLYPTALITFNGLQYVIIITDLSLSGIQLSLERKLLDVNFIDGQMHRIICAIIAVI